MKTPYSTIKMYMRLDDDAEKERIEFLALGVEAAMEKYIEDELPEPVPYDLQLYVCQRVEDAYRNTGTFITGTILTELPDSGKALLNPYRQSNFIG